MFTCVLCRFAVLLDDAQQPTPAGTCICLRCWLAGTGRTLPMPRALRASLEHALATMSLFTWAMFTDHERD